MWTFNKVVVVLYCFTSFVPIDKGCRAQCFSANSRQNANYSRAEFDSVLGQLPPVFKFRQQDNTTVVKLQFSVPFFKIPIQSTTKRTSEFLKELRDANKSWVYSAVRVVTGIGIAFGLFHSQHFIVDAATQLFSNFNVFRGLRNGRNEQSATEFLMYLLENYDKIQLKHCMQQLICHLVRQSARKVSTGKGSNLNKVIDGVTSNHFIVSYLSGIELKDYIESGRNGRSCSSSVKSCGNFRKYLLQLAYKI